MDNIFPMNLPPDGGVEGTGSYVYVVLENSVVVLVTVSFESANDRLNSVMRSAAGLGPWHCVSDDENSFIWTGPCGSMVMCNRYPVMP